MNRLQGIDDRHPLFVSLNPKREIPAHLVFDETEFDHPMFDAAALAAQSHVAATQGRRHTWFAGAHLGHGFHEDGLASAVAVARGMGIAAPWRVTAPSDVPRPRPLPGLVAQPAWS